MSDLWKSILLRPDQAIRECLEILDKGSLRIALVVDDAMTLLGVLTDGDVRRALLRNITMDSPVSDIMTTTPVTADQHNTRKEIVELMEQKQLLVVPLLDGKTLVGLETLLRSGSARTYDNPVFLMAGGFGTRLRPLTNDCPKPMLKVGDKPILETVLRGFKNAGFYNFYISLHYLPNVVRDYFGDGSKWDVNIQYVLETEPLGTGGALGLLPDDMPDLPLIVMNGDLLTQVDYEILMKFHTKNSSQATMCVREYTYQIPFGVVNGEGNQISGMIEKPSYRHFVNAGIYVIERALLNKVLKNQKMNMPDLFEQCIEDKKKVLMFPIHEYWLDIGRLDDFEKAQQDILNLDL
ncbi:nucleotidyltransferase family protein [uncultured Sulfitobacter sp.]|uniref:nucleotidyltransferase family protein n=1 Tax=uncultured Sulfitobacter sp. TaxID=191468 RepID=UPI0030D98EA7